jgi:hypothetical protein
LPHPPLPGEITQGFKNVGVINGKMDLPHFQKWLAMTFDGADDTEFHEGCDDLLAAASPAAVAGQNLPLRLKELADRLFKQYDQDKSGFLDFSEFFMILKVRERSALPPASLVVVWWVSAALTVGVACVCSGTIPTARWTACRLPSRMRDVPGI